MSSINGVNCPACNSSDFRRKGYYADGSVKVVCKSCGKYYKIPIHKFNLDGSTPTPVNNSTKVEKVSLNTPEVVKATTSSKTASNTNNTSTFNSCSPEEYARSIAAKDPDNSYIRVGMTVSKMPLVLDVDGARNFMKAMNISGEIVQDEKNPRLFHLTVKTGTKGVF